MREGRSGAPETTQSETVIDHLLLHLGCTYKGPLSPHNISYSSPKRRQSVILKAMDVSGSPPQRQSFFSGIITRRTRSSSVPPTPQEPDPSPHRRRAALPPSPATASTARLQPAAPTQQPSTTPVAPAPPVNHFPGSHFPIVPAASSLSTILRRRRDSNGHPPEAPPPRNMPHEPPTTNTAPQSPPGQAHRIRLVPHLESTRSLPFEPIIRDPMEGGSVLKVGRFTDRQQSNTSSANAHNSLKIAFKSKVVSRGHAELWVEPGGKVCNIFRTFYVFVFTDRVHLFAIFAQIGIQFFIKDTSSSSGTFLNHVRLSAPGVTSRPYAIKDGDVIQLGVDYQGGQQEIYRCVKIKVEVGRGWQSAANAFK